MSSYKRKQYTRYRRKRMASKYRSSALAKKNQSEIRMMKINQDLKFKDVIVDDAVVASTGLVLPQIFTIGNGDTANQKDGLKVIIKSISIRFQLRLPSSADKDNASDICRVLLLKDRQANGALPAVADIITATDIISFRTPANSRRFTTLFDKTVTINALGGAGNGTVNTTLVRNISWQYHKKLNWPIYYNDSITTGLIAQINSNNLVILVISESGLCGLKTHVRVRYLD